MSAIAAPVPRGVAADDRMPPSPSDRLTWRLRSAAIRTAEWRCASRHQAIIDRVQASRIVAAFAVRAYLSATPTATAISRHSWPRAPPPSANPPPSQSPHRNRRPRPKSKLPEWNLADLYPAIDAPEVKRDLERLDEECVAFETAYKGKLADELAQGRRRRMARRGGQALRGDRRPDGPARLLCGPDPCRRHRRSRRSRNSTATCRSG